MKAEDIIGLSIYVFVALMIIIIGIFQYRSKKPVSFYTTEDPLPNEKYIDIIKWNHYHGLMFMIYGFIIILGCLLGMLIIKHNDVLSAIVCIVFVIFPLPIVILIHERLKKKYINK